MYKQTDNAQVNNSLRELSRGLFYYLQTEKLEKITVSKICAQAGIARQTFYRNCRTKTDLVLFACDERIKALLDSSALFQSSGELMYRHFFEYWYGHRDFLNALSRNRLEGLFARHFAEFAQENPCFPLPEEIENDAVRRRFGNVFLLGGLTQMLMAWTREGFEASPETMAETVLGLLR